MFVIPVNVNTENPIKMIYEFSKYSISQTSIEFLFDIMYLKIFFSTKFKQIYGNPT